ncbi:MAG: prolyl oligopeptidase family serine peptidase [Promethearchaeota archaeon]
MLSIYERLKIALEANSFFTAPVDFSKKGDLFLYRQMVDSGGFSLIKSSLDNPQDQDVLLPSRVKFFGPPVFLSPDDKYILAGNDPDGTEKSYLCRFNVSASIGESNDIQEMIFSKIEPHRLLYFSWSPDGRSLLYDGTYENGFHVSRIANDLNASPEPALADEYIANLVPWIVEWSNQNLAFMQGTRLGGWQEGILVIFNPVTTEVLSEISTQPPYWFFQKWNPKRPIVPLLQPDGDFGKLSIYNAESGELREIPQPDGELGACVWSPDGNYFYQQAMKDGRSTVHEIDINESSIRMLEIPIGSNKPYHVQDQNGERILFYTHTDAAKPIELWAHNLETGSNEKLTHWQSDTIGSTDFPVVQTRSIKYKSSFDGTSIHGFLLLPSRPPPAGGFPCLAWIHGGPASHIEDDFSGVWQVFTQEGFAIFAPHYRGSTGYGLAFTKSLLQEVGRADLQDVSSGVDYIVENFDINPKKIGITGGSYGGYMTLAALAFQPNRWTAGYASAPIADWTYMADHSDALFKDFLEELWGDPKENRALMMERSPISKVDDIKAPLAISVASNDSRTPFAPVLEFANRLFARNHFLEFHVRPQAGHLTIRKDETIRDAAGRLDFFKTQLDFTR